MQAPPWISKLSIVAVVATIPPDSGAMRPFSPATTVKTGVSSTRLDSSTSPRIRLDRLTSPSMPSTRRRVGASAAPIVTVLRDNHG